MRVYQFRHVGTVAAYYSALPPTSAIILAFGVLRQTNFRYPECHSCCEYSAFLRDSLLPPRKTEIIAEQFEMSKLRPKYFQGTAR